MVNEKHSGTLLVQLGPKLQAHPEKLLRQRRGHDDRPEYLVRWSVVSLEERAAGGSSAASGETKAENISLWMSAEEVSASCPALLGHRRPEGPRLKEEKAPGPLAAVVPLDEASLDEASLLEMKADVRSLVQRARRQVAEAGSPECSILSTVHVLGAYASIGSLAGAFREAGALELLTAMLCHREKRIRRGAGEMLRALGAHDAGIWAYVLLSLSQQDGIEQHMDFDSRCTLLELFAEITSSAEHRMSFEGIHLPQIPGKQLFVLVKRYLCVTSLLDKLSSGVEQGEEQQGCAVPSPVPEERSRVKQEFEFSMAMANLISELVRAMGWSHGHEAEPLPRRDLRPGRARSIFQHKTPAGTAAEVAPASPAKEPVTFKRRSAFPSRSSYAEYVQATLVSGMRVRMLEDYEQISAGDEGDFCRSNDGVPPVQVYWQALGSTYWVHWHMVEIIGPSEQKELEGQEKVNSLTRNHGLRAGPQPLLCKPLGGLYSLPYLGQRLPRAADTLSRAEWWELLFFVRKLEAQEQKEITCLIQQHQGEQVDEEALMQLSVPVELAQKVLQVLEERCQGSSLRDLRGSRVYARHFLGRGAEQHGGGSTAVSSEGERSTGPEGMMAKTAEGNLSAAPGPAQGRGVTLKSDSELFSELLEREGLFLPEVTEEQSQALGGSKGLSESGSLAKVAAVVEVIQSSSSALGLRLAGLKHILKMLEEEPESEQQVGTAQGGLGIGSAGEKLVQVSVELLSTEVAEKALVAVTLRLLAVLLARYKWRVAFATEGGVRAVLACMQQHGCSALVQQAGLAALKVLVGAADAEPGGAGGKCLPWNHGDAQMMREIFASIGSASSKGSASLLSSIPAALSTMQRVPGGSSGVQNGLLVVNVLMDGHRGLAEQLANCDLLAVLQSCWRAGQSSGCPQAVLALSAINRLAEHGLPLGPEAAGREVLLDAKGVQMLLGGVDDGVLSKEVVVALERQLCSEGSVCSGQVAQLLQDHSCFRLLLRSLELLGTEKAVSLSILRILNKFLDSYQEDVLPWHECVEPCVSFLITHSSSWEVLQEVVGFLHRLGSASKDCVVVMCHVGTHEALSKALEKHSTVPSLAPALLELVTECEKYAGLYKKLTSSILAGCIQLVLGQIEEHRRSHQPISIPFFDVFLHNLCQGSSMEVKEDKCWEKVQVSSNSHQASKLMDRNPKTYWESNGSTGSHFITVHMQCGVVIRELSMLVASEDSSYMPSRVVVLGGDSPATIRTELNAVSILPSDSRVILLENMTRFWPVIQIRVKRCQQGGIDTRVRGIEVLGPKPTFWPIFREQLCRRTFLSCTARAHAWSQEICRDRGRLLQLFGRLNRALQHEQGFANRFLPDEEAARALGRTFWEALVNPLVQSITSPDPDGVSPLAWLLSEYLESVELPCRATGRRAAFGSCVRRLTQLLVHVDPGGPEPEETRAAGGKEGKNKEVPARTAKVPVEKSRGLWGISQCWRGVVQQQVQRFLEAAGQAPDLAERYCRLYQRLRGATEELFGQQAAFVLALGQGFAGALLQLSFLTALHVSEQFARYLDVQIQELRRAAGSTGPLERLQQFLEPFVVFSGLEFAHTFEHFYRHYLGDRLLTQGPSWLEEGIVEQIGLCFPSRFPQDMLSNLAESEKLQRQFCLFQLQEQDKRLLELDTGLDEVLGAAAVADVPEVKVLALSPCCWPVSPLCFMDNPGRFFPAVLSSPLDEFADFCRQSQSQLGWECTKPRRLQWTWLGHAELQFGDCVLHVSTLQMYILLCFNSAQEVAVEALLQATGLPADLVHHALTPLTHGQGVLVGSCAPGEVPADREGRGERPGKEEERPVLPHHPHPQGGEAAAHRQPGVQGDRCLSEGRVGPRGAVPELLLPQRGRAVLHPAPAEPGLSAAPGGEAACLGIHLCRIHSTSWRPSTDDFPVQVSPGISGGGRQRQPALVGLHVTRCGGVCISTLCEYGTFLHVRRNPGTDRVEEYLMAMLQVPMGHTLSPEEAKLLMNQTVQQVQDTLSIPDDVARHLLMHCRWNVDFLIQCYVENREALLISSGLQVQDVQPPPSPGTHCPVCVNQLCPTEKPPTLCCMHYCCKPCWREYLTTRIEQNMVVNCTCPISECRAQPTTAFIYSIVSSEDIIAKYEKALLRRYVECCSNLTWCTNPQGCDQILLKDGLGYGAACSKCSWISCFNCNFPEAHYPASCSHMSRWVDDDGYYEGMTSEAQSKHLAKLISKHCPNCQAQIEKNEGCLHMTCAKCNHGFCWRCLKPWRPNHKDYYNCSAMVSKAAWQEKRFQDYNERCTFHHHAREFAVSLRNSISSIREMPKIRNLTFVLDACKVLEQARKVLAYSCVYSYYNQDTESMDIVEQQTESLELLTNALQILLEETLLQYQDLATSLQLLKAEHFHTGLELVRQIKQRLFAILWHSTQDFHVGLQTSGDAVQRKLKLANVPASALACAGQKRILVCDSPNTDEGGKEVEDEEYDPQWQEDYDDDDDDLDEDNFMIDNDSDCDSYFDDNDSYRS
ncbi:cullin-9 isoform X3 [Motacilla alba alba]|uniref:cullin-9 isoform X3 n=1 Tax=Motacilla alba alba TaxID=1094192 RepID=UPI0018D54092|nr:cullin-9 isoform X3 [Motacilla alba alba]